MKIRILVLLAVFVAASSVGAQEFRGTISGVVTDPSGAPVPNVTVTATERRTGTKVNTVTNSAGEYTIPFLLPGNYELQAEAQGFKRFVRTGIQLASGTHPVIDMELQIGAVAESVEVTGGVPLIDTDNASTGQTITTKQVEDFPLNGRTPMMLAQLSIGVLATSNPAQVHPFDNNAAAAWSIAGTPAQTSELLMDGTPDEIWSGALAYSPPQDAVQEVTVDAFNTDAAYGHSMSGTANQVLKQGTNQFHGSMYEFNQADALGANLWINDEKGIAKQVTHFNQYGLTAGAPVIIPKLLHGRNKLFWFFAWENLDDAQPTGNLATVPTDAEKQGDFSALSALGSQYQLYNPYAAVQSGKVINRAPFSCDASGNPLPPNTTPGPGYGTQPAGGTPCNKIPSALFNPISLAYLKFFPEPNATGQADGFQNYANTNTSQDSFDNELGRLDYNMSSRSHLFFDIRHNFRSQAKNNYFGDIATGVGLTRLNWGTTLDEVYTFSPTLVADVRANWEYMGEVHNDPSTGFDPTTLGFPSYVASSSPYRILPAINFNGSCGSQASFQCLGNTGDSRVPSESYQLFGDVAKISGKHSFKFGVDLRRYQLNVNTYGSSAGSYTFASSGWTNGPTSSSPAAPFGQDFAEFLLGLPTSGTYSLNASGVYRSYYYAGFVQDDWRLKRTLTLNLGLRFEHDTPYGDVLGRTENGFDFTAASPIEAAAQAAFAKDFPAGLSTDNGQSPLTQFNVLGGLTFANRNDNAMYSVSSHMFSPRIGFAWSPDFLHNATVIRGGFGIFVAPIDLANLGTNGNFSSDPIMSSYAGNQEGFSASTQFVATSNNFLSPATNLSQPFPGGISEPVGSSAGLGTFLGQTVSFLSPQMHDPYSIRWNFGVQHTFSSNLLLEVDYLGNHGVHLPVETAQANPIPAQYLSTQTTRDQTVINALSASVANPLKALLPGTSLNGSTISTAQLVALYPEFPQGSGSTTSGIVDENATSGSSYFNSLDVRVEKRLSYGLSAIGNYTFSKLIEADDFLNATDTRLERRISPFDHTQHFALGFTYDLPIGTGRAVNLRSRWVNAFVGGWTVNGIYSYQTGGPIDWSNSDYVYLGGPLDFDATRTSSPILNTAAFDTNSKDQFQYHIRTWPSTLSSVRFESIENLDSSILKDFHFTERVYFQLRLEAFNSFNHPQFGAFSGSSGPNMSPTSSAFGEYNGQSNIPRAIQLGGRLVW
jgi:hypothetical protein